MDAVLEQITDRDILRLAERINRNKGDVMPKLALVLEKDQLLNRALELARIWPNRRGLLHALCRAVVESKRHQSALWEEELDRVCAGATGVDPLVDEDSDDISEPSTRPSGDPLLGRRTRRVIPSTRRRGISDRGPFWAPRHKQRP